MISYFTRRTFLSTVFGGAALSLASSLAASTAAAEDYVKDIGDNVLRLANGGTRGRATRTKFASLLGRYVNLQSIALSSLGPYKNKLPAGDKGKFRDLVTTYAAALFAWYVDDFKGEKFVVDRATKQGKFVVVYSKIIKSGGGADEPIVWYLAPSGGGYKVVDISVLGVRLSLAMRKKFGDELKKSKGDFEALYAELREAETW